MIADINSLSELVLTLEED